MMATFLPVGTMSDRSGRQPIASAVSVMYFSEFPIVTAPKPSFSVQAPSHRRSCGQTVRNLRQRIGLVAEFRCLEEIALSQQL